MTADYLHLTDRWTDVEVHDELSEVLVVVEGKRPTSVHLQRDHARDLRDWLTLWLEEGARDAC